MVTIQADEISNIIRERIEQYNREVKIVNTGTVLQVGDGIARIHGLCFGKKLPKQFSDQIS